MDGIEAVAGFGSGGDLTVMLAVLIVVVGIVEIGGLGEENEGATDNEDGAEHGYGWSEGDIKRPATVSS